MNGVDGEYNSASSIYGNIKYISSEFEVLEDFELALSIQEEGKYCWDTV